MKKMLLILALACTCLQISAGAKWVSIGEREVTCYKLNTRECDAEPNIGAYGRIGRKGCPTGFWVAANFLSKGTRVKIPKLTGDIVWVVMDKTSRKFNHRIDLCFPPKALTLGLRKVEVFVEK